MNKGKWLVLFGCIVVVLIIAKVIGEGRLGLKSEAGVKDIGQMSARFKNALPSMLDRADARGADGSMTKKRLQSVAMSAGSVKATSPSVMSDDRKIIKRAEVDLEVKNCDETAQVIAGIAKEFSGIVVDSEISKSESGVRSGYMVIKVPPSDFNVVLLRIKSLGRADREKTESEDVTEEYVDLDVRLKNAEVIRDRLTKILEDKAHKIEDILNIERELNRVRGTIEHIKTRIQVLSRKVELAVITVHYREPRNVVPGQPKVTRGFKETLRIAIDTFLSVTTGLILVTAMMLPILVWAGLILLIIVLMRMVFIRKR